MTETERIELLKAVAECAPEEMGVQVIYGIAGPALMFGGISVDMDTSPFLYLGKSELGTPDINNATAIIALLDAMEKAGVRPSLCRLDGPTYRVILFDCGPAGNQAYPCVDCSTRAEAVSRAFVKVFGGEK